MTYAKPSPVNFIFWSKRDLWSIYELSYLLLGLEPMKWGSLADRNQFPPKKVMDLFETLRDLAQDARDLGLIKPLSIKKAEKFNTYSFPWQSYENESNKNWAYSERYSPYHLLEWVQSKGYSIPEELKPVLSKSVSRQQEPAKWGYQHDTKLLIIARKIIDEYWEGKDINSVPSKDAIVAELREQYPNISESEAKAIDIVTRHDKLRKSNL